MNKLTPIIILFAITLMYSFIATGQTKSNSPLAELNQLMQQHQGKVVYLDFWASWCGPCRKSFPWMNAMQKKYHQQGFVVISINLDSDKQLAVKFLQQTPAQFTIIYDNKGKLANKFQLKGMPSSFLFNRQGMLLSSHSGFNGKKKTVFEQEILEALANN